jgi:DNA-binding MarR family transcriptional regulator
MNIEHGNWTAEQMIRLSDDEIRAWQGLLHAHQRVIRVLDAELRAEHSMSLAEYDVLLRLARAPDRALKMSDLAKRVMMSPSGLTRVIDRLCGAGLVTRERIEEDARVMLARLTQSGRQRLRAAAQTHLRGIRQHYTSLLSPSQLRSVGAGLEQIAGPHRPH